MSRIPCRHKTFVRKDTKARKRFLELQQEKLTKGEPFVRQSFPIKENRFWKIEGNMKIYKPITPSMRGRKHPTRFHLHKGSAIRRLTIGKRSTGGRNDTGKITVRHRGSGHKRRLRVVDFHRNNPGPHQVVRIEYDPGRSADLCLLRNLSTNEFSYILHSNEVAPGDILYSWRRGMSMDQPMDMEDSSFSKSKMIQRGNCLQLKDIPVGTIIHCIGLKPNGKAQLCRSAGTYGQLLFTASTGFAQVRLQSGEVRQIPVEACATIGMVGNPDYHHTKLGKAGANRRRGIRPTVRGIAMNAVTHPHGGGGKSKGNKHPRSIWGWKTKGRKTVRKYKPYVITPRWKAKMNS